MKPESTKLTVSKREEILRDVIGYVTKDRNATHGEPEDNFQTIADLWNAYLKARMKDHIAKVKEGSPIPFMMLTAQDVAVLNILQKVARIVQTPYHRDHWADICGYGACGGGIETK